MRFAFPCLLVSLLVGCATAPAAGFAPEPERASGPWSEVPVVEMPTGEKSIPISLLRDVADALLRRPGAKTCNPATQRPIPGLSTEYCSTVYVAGTRESLSWRVTEPVKAGHNRCAPFFEVQDADYPSTQVWVVGFIHNHPCGAAPSSQDLDLWPTDAVNPTVALAEVRLIPGNPAPARFRSTFIEMASAVVAERQDGTRIFLRYFPTGEIEQWSEARRGWILLGRCAPAPSGGLSVAPRCDGGALRLLRE
ncbi:hypothetical protein OV208_33975 [Corallococcus sp. bb12-1]|uniref:hypothetical protein n=1 Tax=Corallococcus sp. bb12-1 TaxID=2996784 RepID=UPI00226D9E6D|nr:hypothetical protein [Corallococcus sp. bb12-1]MCY1046363.1 hypothetical protein [Corallococcus sp. bb12-1]